jgi:hypothetical protein
VKGKFTTNQHAAGIIKRFISGSSDRYEWDDFETIPEKNPVVDLAIRLCWYFAAKFPATKPTEYCSSEADPWFLRIANALEKGSFADLDYEGVKQSLAQNKLPETVQRILETA